MKLNIQKFYLKKSNFNMIYFHKITKITFYVHDTLWFIKLWLDLTFTLYRVDLPPAASHEGLPN